MHKYKLSIKAQTILVITLIIAAAILFSIVVGPYIILEAVRQPATEEHIHSDAFLTNYDEVRINLFDRIDTLMQSGVTVEYEAHAIDADEGLFIDKLHIPATKKTTNLLVITTGVHGIEGYIGSAMLDVFFEDIFPGLNRENTGVLIVANVNPYGMKYMRSSNENNVDLTKNFIMDWDTFDSSSNQGYSNLLSFLQPEEKIENAVWHEIGYHISALAHSILSGTNTILNAALSGQYEYPEGISYGGNSDEASTTYIKKLFSNCLSGPYKNIIHIDITSGYGSRYDMSIMHSAENPILEADAKTAFKYNNVVAKDSANFYSTYGNINDYFYLLAENNDSEKTLYSASFAFGTIGNSNSDSLLKIKYMIDENRQHRFPTDNEVTAQIIHQNYLELFYPTEKDWRVKAIEDFTAAMNGVLNAKLK